MHWVFDMIEDPRFGSLVAALILFSIPTVILGMISPYSVRLIVDNVAESGQVAGYGYNFSSDGQEAPICGEWGGDGSPEGRLLMECLVREVNACN